MTVETSNMFQFFVEHGLPVCTIEEIRRVQVNFTFDSFDDQDEGNSEMPVIGRDYVELAKSLLL